jgi:hypothetical protein
LTIKLVKDQIIKIIFSGFYETVDEILCFVTGFPPALLPCQKVLERSGKKFKVVELGPNDTTYERFTLSKLPKYVKEDDKVFYIHTKGVTKPGQENVIDWKNLLEYGIFVKHKECIRLLDTYDIVSTMWRDKPEPHFSGNIWCATGKYLLTLPSDIPASYNAPEYWIAYNNPKYRCIWDSKVENHYFTEYSFSNYVDSDWFSTP